MITYNFVLSLALCIALLTPCGIALADGSSSSSKRVFSPDGKHFAFVANYRESKDLVFPNYERTADIFYGEKGHQAKILVKAGTKVNIENELVPLNEIEQLLFSNDGRELYITCGRWVTSSAIVSIDIKTKKPRYVTSCCGDFKVIRTGRWKNNLIVVHHRYYGPPKLGSYFPKLIFSPKGKELKLLEWNTSD